MNSLKYKWFITSVGAAQIYSKPKFSSETVSETLYGESNKILKLVDDWVYVECEDGYRGWVKKFFGKIESEKNNFKFIIAYPNKDGFFDPKFPFGSRLKIPKKGTKSIGQNLDWSKIIPLAEQLLGIPYKWGGKSSLGFDCSGLVQTIFKVCGYNLPRDSFKQREFFDGHEVKMEETCSGDLHFFGEHKKVSHVGLSIGNNELIHCQGTVKKESLNPNHTNFNKSLENLHICSVSIRAKLS